MTSAFPGNFPTPFANSFTPALQGATDNPVVTYSTQIGRYTQIGNIVLVTINLVTTTMTKTTLTDLVRVSLPFTIGGATGSTYLGAGRIENGTPISNAVHVEGVQGNAFLLFRAIPVTTASLPTTYAVASPGIGVLTNTITFNGTLLLEI